MVNGAGSHDRRYGTCPARHEGNHTFAAQPHFAHEFVHKENYPGHITGFFQDGNEGKQHCDLRYKDDNAANARHNSFGDQFK